MKKIITILFCLATISCFGITKVSSVNLKNTPYIDIRSHGALGDGITDNSAAITAAILAASSVKNILIPYGNYLINSDITVPGDIKLIFSNGGFFSVSSGHTLSMLGDIDSEKAKIFSGSGTILLSQTKKNELFPEWFGATGDGITDDTFELQQMANSIQATATIKMNGAYLISDSISISSSYDLEIIGGKIIANGIVGSDSTGVYTDAFALIGSSTANLKLSNISFSGDFFTPVNVLIPYGNISGVSYNGWNLVELESLSCDNFSFCGIRPTGTRPARISIKNCYIDNCLYAGIVGASITFTTLENCYVSDIGYAGQTSYGYGIQGTSDSWAIIESCGAINCARYSYDGRYAFRLKISDCFSYNVGFIHIYAINEDATKKVSEINISGCSLVNSGHYGIWAGSFGSFTTVQMGGIKIDNNYIYGSLNRGIAISSFGPYQPREVTITNNSIASTTNEVAIFCDTYASAPAGQVEMITISNNQIRDSAVGVPGTDNGITVGNAKNLVVTNNVIVNSQGMARALTAVPAFSGWAISNCVISGNIASASSFAASPAWYCDAINLATSSNIP